MLEKDSLAILNEMIVRLDEGFHELPSMIGESNSPELKAVLMETATRMQDNYPYFHPNYAGQMLKPPHTIARIAYAMAMLINPNNHALDGGRASSQMEKEAVAEIAAMFGWPTHLGHLTSGGTMANLEALWIAGQLQPGKKILASAQAHYTHKRISSVLGLEFESIPCDRFGRISIEFLQQRLKHGDIGTVVATMGTTAIGSVDPLSDLLALQAQYQFRLHADAAYGGYFGLIDNLAANAGDSFDQLHRVDSIVIDPHKHGLQPYGCGCVLFRDPAVGHFYKHDSPYTYFSSDELHLGEISLECSRPGAAAVALWATQRLFPLVKDGEFAKRLTRSRLAALSLYDRLVADPRFITAFPPELDIVVWSVRAESVSQASQRARQIFHDAAQQQLHLALAELPVEFFDLEQNGIVIDQERITCLRSVLMKPEHLEWIDQIWQILDRVTDGVV